MARSNAAGMNGGWPPRRQPEHDPRGARPGQGQHPGQPGQAPNYAQPGYPDPQAGYDPQLGYHYPQQQPQAPQQPAPGGPRRGLSSLEGMGQQGNDFPSYQQPTQSPYGQPQQPQGYGQPPHQDPHTQQGVPPFRPASAAPPFGNAQPAQPSPYDQWQQPQAQQQPHQPQQDPLGYDLGGYLPNGGQQHADPHHQPQHGDWSQAHLGYDPAMGDDPYQGGHHGYEPAHGGALEQAYGHDEPADYDVEEPRRGSWALRIAGAVVVAWQLRDRRDHLVGDAGGVLDRSHGTLRVGVAVTATLPEPPDGGPARVPSRTGTVVMSRCEWPVRIWENGAWPPPPVRA